jgi:hypothetical protein
MQPIVDDVELNLELNIDKVVPQSGTRKMLVPASSFRSSMRSGKSKRAKRIPPETILKILLEKALRFKNRPNLSRLRREKQRRLRLTTLIRMQYQILLWLMSQSVMVPTCSKAWLLPSLSLSTINWTMVRTLEKHLKGGTKI